MLEIIDDNKEIILDEDGIPPYLEVDLYCEVSTTPISKGKIITLKMVQNLYLMRLAPFSQIVVAMILKRSIMILLMHII